MTAKSEKQKKEELAELLELKKKVASAELEADAQARLIQLNNLHAAYAKMDAEQMEADLKKKPSETSLSISHSRDHDLIIQDYNAQFSCKPGYIVPETKNGYTKLCFASEAEAGDFFQAQAAKGRSFGIYREYDGQMRAVAYSNGDGNLYHANGTVYKPGDSFVPVEGATKDKFKLPREDKTEPATSSAPVPTRFGK